MTSIFLAAVAFLAGTAHAGGPIASVGERIGDATVVELVEHFEFHGIKVQLPDQRELLIEVVQTDEPRGACTHHGFAVQPRWELLGVHDMQVEEQPAVVTELCARIGRAPPVLDLRPPMGEDPDAPAQTHDEAGAGPSGDPASGVFVAQGRRTGFRVRPLHAVFAALLLTLAGGLARTRKPFGVDVERPELLGLAGITALGGVLRYVLGLWAPLWSPWFGFGRLASVLADHDSVSRYGDGYAATMSLFTPLFGESPGTVFGTNFVVGTLTVPLVWAVVRVLAPKRPGAALAAGLFAAMLPVHVWQSATEVMHVWLVAFEVAALWAAALFIHHGTKDRLAGLLFAVASASATVLAFHTRPEALAFVGVVAAYVLLHARRKHGPALALAVLGITVGLVFRLAEMAYDITDEASALDYSLLRDPGIWLRTVLPDLSTTHHPLLTSVWARPALTSPLVPLLAVVGALTVPRRLGIALGIWWAATLIPVLPKGWPLADAYRLQAPALMAAVVMAGLGAHFLWTRARTRLPESGRTGLWALGGLAVALLPQLFWERPDWGTLDEARLLLSATDHIEPTATVFYDSPHSHAESMASFGSLTAPGSQWAPMSSDWDSLALTRPLMAWISTSCTDQGNKVTRGPDPSTACVAFMERCTLRPAHTQSIPLTGDLGFDFVAPGPVEVGLYYVDDCTTERQ